MNHSCVGFLELGTIARGIEATDAMLKKATVHLLFAHPVSTGKYLIGFEGEVEEVRSALAVGREVAAPALLDFFFLPNIHPAILPSIQHPVEPNVLGALGILETVTCASCVIALDAALKTSEISLIKIELGKGIGGKAYFIVQGEVGDVESAMAAAVRAIKKQGIIEQITISQATPRLLQLFSYAAT